MKTKWRGRARIKSPLKIRKDQPDFSRADLFKMRLIALFHKCLPFIENIRHGEFQPAGRVIPKAGVPDIRAKRMANRLAKYIRDGIGQ